MFDRYFKGERLQATSDTMAYYHSKLMATDYIFGNQRVDIDILSKHCKKTAAELLTHLFPSCCATLFAIYS